MAEGANAVAGSNTGEVEGGPWVALDYADKTSFLTAMKGVSTLFMVLPNHPDMVQWGENIVDAAKESGVAHVVRSTGSLANSSSPLTIERLLGTSDGYLVDSSLDYTLTAPNFFMQNFINFFADDFKSGTLAQPAGDGKIAWVDVRDIAAVNVVALLSPDDYRGQTLTITGADSLGYGQAVARMNSILGRTAKYLAVPDEAAIEAMTAMGLPEFVVDLMISLNRSIRQGHATATTDTVERMLGRAPIGFDRFVEDHRAAWS